MSRIGRFEIQQQVSTGTRSTTYRGIDAETQRPVAIKAIPHEAIRSGRMPVMSRPSKRIRPRVGASIPESMLMMVVFPAPFVPMSP